MKLFVTLAGLILFAGCALNPFGPAKDAYHVSVHGNDANDGSKSRHSRPSPPPRFAPNRAM